ncbi:MAG: heme-binding protein [Thiohalomonadales bacterium]
MMNKIIFLKLQMLIISSILVTSSQAVADDIKILDLENPEIKSDNKPPPVKKAALDQIKPDLKVLYKTQNLTPEAALVVAQAAMKNCRESGYQVSVAVLDKGGIVQVLLRDRLAGNKTPDIAVLKAQTALSFKASTSSLANSVLENKNLDAVKDVPGVLFLAGGVNISAAGSIIGSIGVSGAPDSKFDERCAIIGLKPIEGLLEFSE